MTLTILTSIITYGQTSKKLCNCPKNDFTGTKADTIFTPAKGKQIALCGYRNPGSKPTNFSEFVLAVCGQDKVLGFWDAIQTCYVKTKKDTLLVENIFNLPTGKNRTYKITVWATDKIFFKNQKIIKTYSVNRNILKYNQTNITKTLKEFENSKGRINDGKMELANRLFIATISGNKTARKYFKSFETKFGELDGAFSEEYSDLKIMLAQWDQQK